MAQSTSRTIWYKLSNDQCAAVLVERIDNPERPTLYAAYYNEDESTEAAFLGQFIHIEEAKQHALRYLSNKEGV